MAQHSQTAPSIAASIGGTTHQVNLRDYLNVRVYPFLKKAITESLEASPEFPLQWLGENLIQQSMLYEGNPDSTKIKERFLYKFDAPATAPLANDIMGETSTHSQSTPIIQDPSEKSVPVMNGARAPESVSAEDAPMSSRVSNTEEHAQDEQGHESRDTEMEGTS